MFRTLGLDIGTNSIGWALIQSDEEGTCGGVLALGSRVFPEGVNRDTTGAEHSKNEERRIARGMRRQIARRARRKGVLRRSLVAAGLLPTDIYAQHELDTLDPYVLRSEGLTRKLEPYEIGRLLVHLNQRRGFLSNRKADRGRKNENSATLQAISDLANNMGDQTLGQYFAAQRAADPHRSVRGVHTRREMYIAEFQAIWDAQAQYYPELLTPALRYGKQGDPQQYPREPKPLTNRKSNSLLLEYGLYGILFFQRSLYWPKSVIGRCELTGEKRCPRADRIAQRYRLLADVNNLRVLPEYAEARSLTAKERNAALAHLASKKERTFDELRKALGLLDSDTFNLERADRKKLLGLPIDVELSKKALFGKAWAPFPEELKNQIVRSLIDEEDSDILRKATSLWGCDEELAHRLVDFDPTSFAAGYASYSRTAMERLLPHLERGLPLMGDDATNSALHAAGFLRPDERTVRQSEQLPEPPAEIVNPIVRQALYEVRKLVHAVIREYGKPDRIHLELAREAKGTADQRARSIRDMRENERKRDKAALWIREQGGVPTRDTIQRYLLWDEQGQLCIYSNRPISPAQLLGGEVDVDHILPYSRSLDNSLMNKVVTFRSENARKGQRTPHEWLAEQDPEKFAGVLQRARLLPFLKRQRFVQQNVVLEDFLARQLSDTAYITTCVRQYLTRLGVDIVCTKGATTAELRHQWGLNTVLRDDDINLKSRDDHRHHAIDALVIALTSRSHLQRLARTRGSDAERLPFPWEGFRSHVEDLAAGIKVSHRAARKIAGALHEKNIYGPTSKPQPPTDQERRHAKDWVEEAGTFVISKDLTALTIPMIELIRDNRVKELVIQRLQKFGVDHTAKGANIPKDAWNEPLYLVPRTGNSNRTPNPVKYVRVLRRDQTITSIRGGTACVKPGSTHHICLFELPESTPAKRKRVKVSVPMLEVARRQKDGLPLISRVHPTIPAAKFLFSLSWGEMVCATIRGREDLYVYRTGPSTESKMCFVLHTDARPSSTAKVYNVAANIFDGVKVTVDPLGRIRNAND